MLNHLPILWITKLKNLSYPSDDIRHRPLFSFQLSQFENAGGVPLPLQRLTACLPQYHRVQGWTTTELHSINQQQHPYGTLLSHELSASATLPLC